MNTASQNLGYHLGVLREKLQHPTDYELAVHYFLEEFAGDEKFIRESQPEEMPLLLAVLKQVAGAALGKATNFSQTRVMHVPQFRFYHGNALTAGCVVLFFYFQEVDTGIAAFMPGGKSQMQVARFRLTAGLTNPKNN